MAGICRLPNDHFRFLTQYENVIELTNSESRTLQWHKEGDHERFLFHDWRKNDQRIRNYARATCAEPRFG